MKRIKLKGKILCVNVRLLAVLNASAVNHFIKRDSDHVRVGKNVFLVNGLSFREHSQKYDITIIRNGKRLPRKFI